MYSYSTRTLAFLAIDGNRLNIDHIVSITVDAVTGKGAAITMANGQEFRTRASVSDVMDKILNRVGNND